MSIKSDRWIRRMAEQHGLIEPFAPRQVRENGGARIISYGTSSYGYDVRCAREFKIFTNINSTIVDPKQFDEKSFVDVAADVCIIPPNSFALARTVEYFRIPRNVLTVCLGKCVTGDTRVVDADTGAYVPITEMRWGKKTLAFDGSQLRAAKVSDFIPQGVREVFELRTRAGLHIRATGNHPFRMRDRWTPLSELRAGDRIAVAREIPVFGRTPLPDWEATLLGLMISEGQCNTPGHSPTYTTADPAMVKLLECTVAESGLGASESNLANLWLKAHGLNVDAADKFVPQCVFMAPENSVRLFLQALFSGDGNVCHSDEGAFIEYYSNSRRLIEDVHHLLLRFGVFSGIRDRFTASGARAWRVTITGKQQIRRFAERIGFTLASPKQRLLEEQVPPEILNAAARVGGISLGALNIRARTTQSVSLPATTRLALTTADPHLSPLSNGPLWDVVDRIERAGEEEVFDISVPGLHNFVANDMIVHNSTYARCFSADTRVALVDGTSITLEDMAVGHANGELYWGYSVGPNGRVIVSLLDAPRFIGRDSLIEITLDNGQTVRATPDHQFVRRDGRMAPVAELRPNDSLMPLYRGLQRGYEHVYQPINGHLLPTHRLADEWNVRNGLYEDVPGTHRHHIDFNRRNNRPTNLERMAASDHIRMHNSGNYGPDFDPAEHGAAIKGALDRLSEDPEWRAQFSTAQRTRAASFWHDERFSDVRFRLLEARRNQSDATRETHRQAMMRRFQDPAELQRHAESMRQAWAFDVDRRHRQADIARAILRSEITAEVVRSALDRTGSIRGAARYLGCDRSVFRRFPDIIASFGGRPGRNHKIAAIREFRGDHDVYCLTVPEAGNFALDAGIFVKNCGIIVNVTPLEPEWEGHVTLEFSNTTPLPAKIYANEGVAQMLFFESDEVCETSYADRGGKYQGQRGVTLPKA
jgi:deoxycytidine triphosphate deaminase